MSSKSAANNKTSILKRRAEFDRTFKVGRLMSANSWLTARICNNDVGTNRVGWTIPGHVGSAVLRNKFKRWLREKVRALPEKSGTCQDINIVLRKRSAEFYKGLQRKEFDEALEKLFSSTIK